MTTFLCGSKFIRLDLLNEFIIFCSCLVFFFLVTKRKLLTNTAALTAIGMGLWIIFFAGIKWLIPLFVFFGSSNLIGKLFPIDSKSTDDKHGKPRDYFQVICNGFPFIVTASFVNFAPDLTFILLGTAMAAATADTWSSEIGMYFKGTTIDILNFRKQPPGISGGMSWQGTLAGLIGSLLVAVICSYLTFENLNPIYITMVTSFGFGGMCLDSFLGSLFQIKYQKEGIFSDTKKGGYRYHSGFRWMTNDMVNLWSNSLIVLLAGLFFVWMS